MNAAREKARFRVNMPLGGEKLLMHSGNVRVVLSHRTGEPPGVNRLWIHTGDLSLELLPSRGLSAGEAFLRKHPVFWDSPTGLQHPDRLEPDRTPLHIQGVPAPGFGYIESFAGGIELLGLDNWGMPRLDPERGSLLQLHGTVQALPFHIVDVEIRDETVAVTGSAIVRSQRGSHRLPWYRRGSRMLGLVRRYEIDPAESRIVLSDRIRNVSARPLLPEWGYHVTFQPEPGAQIFVPAAHRELRGGGPMAEHHEVWQPSPEPARRRETGVIYKGLRRDAPDNTSTTAIRYKDGRQILVKTPPVPYYQSWLCAGGAGSSEFTFADGSPVLKKNWDGIGIEFGSSALDHDGNTDPSVPAERPLAPGESRILRFEIVCDFR
jgi:galactose mutarotase-like enzyme